MINIILALKKWNRKSRAQAIADGDKYYYTGKPCKRGHYSKRKVNSSTCMECYREKLTPRSLLTEEEIKLRNRIGQKRRWDAKTEEEQRAHRKAGAQRARDYWASLTPEEQLVKREEHRRKRRERWAALTEQEKQDWRDKKTAEKKARIASMSPEELEDYKTHIKKIKTIFVANMSPEELKAWKGNHALKLASLTPDEWREHNDKGNKKIQEWRDKNREHYRKYQREYHAKWTKRQSPEWHETRRVNGLEAARKKREKKNDNESK